MLSLRGGLELTLAKVLMSSWRDFENDKEWSYLRDVGQEKMLQFESQADDLAELVVDKDWPSLVSATQGLHTELMYT